MRPATVAEACRRFRDGQPWAIAIGDFLQAFYAADAAGRAAMLADAPPPWIGDRARYLDMPWFPNAGDDPALMEYLTHASPAEFKSRNVMVDGEPLRRASTPRR